MFASHSSVTLCAEAEAAQTYLAILYEESCEHGKAIERYRSILQVTPDNPVVLDNLAYSLAAHEGEPTEALPLAARHMSWPARAPTLPIRLRGYFTCWGRM